MRPPTNSCSVMQPAGSIVGVDDTARAALLAEVAERRKPYVCDQGLAFPIERNIVIARR